MLLSVTQCQVVVCDQRIIVVSTKEVVKLAAVTVAVVLAFTSVPVGFPLPSNVSSLIARSALGDTNFLKASCIVLPATPLPKSYNTTLVFAVTSPIFCTVVLSAKVGAVSGNRLSFARQSSHRM